MMRPLLTQDTRGIAAVEFAILAPVMFLLITAALELGHEIFARVALDGAVVEAARLATASLETSEATRTSTMRASITRSMTPFALADGKSLSIQTTVYSDFNSVAPEVFNDVNKNGNYDLGEPYTDRNANGRWDNSAPKSGTLGGPGDVVSYTAIFPKKILFGSLMEPLGLGNDISIKATTVMRNEAVVRKGS